MHRLAFIILAFGFINSAAAEPANQLGMPPDLQNAIISTLQAQRNEALDRGASAAAQLIVAQKSLAEAQAQVAALQKQLEETDAKAKTHGRSQN